MNSAPLAPSITVFKGDRSKLESKVNLLERIQPNYFKGEVDKIFKKSWLPVTSTVELPEPGSFIVVDVPPLKASIVVVRGSDGEVRAFYNICRHRANKLEMSERGVKKSFACEFHGWNYSTRGKLVGVTDETQFVGLDKNDYGLIAVHCEVWETFVFVNFDDKPSQTLKEWLGVMHDGYQGFFDTREQIAHWSITVKANWHVTINAFTEGYHSLFLHKATLPDYQGGNDNPMRHRPFLEIMEHHGRYSAKANPLHKMTPVEKLCYEAGRLMYPAFPHIDTSAPNFPTSVNPGRVENWAFDITELFPCFVLINGVNWHQCMWFWPIDENHTEIRVIDYAYPAQTIGDHLSHSYFRVRNREVFREDISTMEAIHASLKTGVMADVVLSQQEMLLQKHYAVAKEMMEHA
jgi:phenylpropionate dioxygenase-like ring-hydroxylating dioxygenase large terminal subunit